jgi:hypothetical protein
MTDEAAPVVVDGITANGENAFTSEAYQIALVVKPLETMTAGDFERWLSGFKMVDDEPIAAQRLRLFFSAVTAGSIIVHCTDKPSKSTMKEINAQHAQWYGSQLIGVYRRLTNIDPL